MKWIQVDSEHNIIAIGAGAKIGDVVTVFQVTNDGNIRQHCNAILCKFGKKQQYKSNKKCPNCSSDLFDDDWPIVIDVHCDSCDFHGYRRERG